MTTTANVTDTELARRVRVELDWNPRIDATGLATSVQDGIVTLAGQVDTYAQKKAAVTAVHEISGVLDVADEVQVRLQGRATTDQGIALGVRAALQWDVFVPDERIRSTVSGGWVTLEGKVDRWQQREDAVRCVERLSGVVGVTNEIEVDPPAVDAVRIRTSIQDAITRRAQREGRNVDVLVRDGVVTLSGRVDSWVEKDSLGRLAAYSPGVKRVVNEVVVDPYA
jgi:osmotically-inducible protein OsmY